MIAVHGATGFTGGLVCDELARRGEGFVAAGRNRQKLQALADRLYDEHGADVAIRVVPELSAEPLDDMLGGVRVLINCVGPFVEYGMPVVEAAVRNRVHYFDTTGEQAFMHDVAEKLGAKAEEQGVSICPACAFEYSPGDCAAYLLAEHGVRNIVVGYATTSGETSRGTKKSIVRIMSETGRTFDGGRLSERKPGYRTYEVPVGERTISGVWIPGGESLTVPRHHPDVESVETCLAMGTAVANVLHTASSIIPATAGILRPLLYKIIERTAADPHEQADETPRFAVVAFDPTHPESKVEVKGEDPYTLTALVICEAAMRLDEGDPAKTGFTSPAALFDPREFMESVGAQVHDHVADGT